MEKILFFGTKQMATFWYNHTLRYLVEKGYDSKKADPTHLELEIGEVRLVYRSMSREREVLCGRKYVDVYYYCENRFDNDFEKAFSEILGAKAIVEKKSCYENFSKYLEDLEKFKKKMSPRNREKKRFKIIKNPEYKNHIAWRKSGVGYTDNLIEYISWNIGSFEAWKMLPIRIIDRTNNRELILSERKNWRVVVSKWLNKDTESEKQMKKEQDYDNFKDAFLYALEQNKEIAKKVYAWLKSDECKELIKEIEKEAKANE